MKTSQVLLNELEGLFISEFRVCQAIHDLTTKERRALSDGDVTRLPALTGQKENLLDRLSRLETAKYDLLRQLDVLPNEASSTLKTLHLIDFLSTIDQDSAQRLLRIQEGSLILRAQVREMTLGNRALAASALKRTNSLQAHLLRLYQLPGAQTTSGQLAHADGHAAPAASAANFAAVFASLIAARDALQATDRNALSGAMEDLQIALEGLSGAQGSDIAASEKPTALTWPAQPAPVEASESKADYSLVETIANLYNQETAYQASLKVSNRMLATSG